MESLFILALCLSAASANLLQQYLMDMATQNMDPAMRSLLRSTVEREPTDLESMFGFNRGSHPMQRHMNQPSFKPSGAGAPVHFSFPPSRFADAASSSLNLVGHSAVKSSPLSSAKGTAPLTPTVYSQSRAASPAAGGKELLSSPAASVPTLNSPANSMLPYPPGFQAQMGAMPRASPFMPFLPRILYWRMMDKMFDFM